MLDIIEAVDGQDLRVIDTVAPKAGNVLSIQLADLEYAQDFGIDFAFFLTSDFQIQTASFKAYLVQRLTESQVNVSQVLETVETLSNEYIFSVGEVKANGNGALIV